MSVSNYLIDGDKFYLSTYISIECARLLLNDKPSHIHEWVSLMDDYIDQVKIVQFGFRFRYENINYYYSCDLDIFCHKYCKTINQVRDLRINKILHG